jgi:peptidyl-prolyl cis-trans isomerase D
MLDALRRGAASWAAKILLFLLVISFAIWGVADVFRGYGQGSLARIGEVEISTEEFQRTYQLELDGLARQLGRRLTAEQARAFGVDGRVLSQLLGAAAIDAHARQMRLALSDETVAEAVRRDPMFRGPDGKFSQLTLEGLLRQAGLNERGFLATRRREEVRQQLTTALFTGIMVPDPLLNILHNFREESRVAQYFTLDLDKAINLPEPDEAKLKETYEANKQQFVTPEYRALGLLRITIEEMKKRVPVSEDEIKAAYEQDTQRYTIPEKRRIQQIGFKDRAAAETAAQAIAGGQSFAEAAKGAGAKDSDIELGLLSKKDFIDPKIAEAAFALPLNQVSDVVEGRFTTVLLKVTEIQPGKQRTLDEVKDEVRDRLAGERAAQELQKLYDQVEDNRSAGKPLKEIGELLNLPFQEIAGTDRTGKAPDGKPALEGADAQRILTAAFRGGVGVDSEAVELGDGGYAWLDVRSVVAEKQKPFEDVKDDVKAVWTDLEKRKALSEAASKFVERAKKGEAFDALAQEAGAKLETSKPFKRYGGAPGLPETAVQQAFVVPKDGAAWAASKDGKVRVVLKVTEVTPAPAPEKADLDRLRTDVARQMERDVLAEYLAALQGRLGVTVNEAAFRRLIGVDQQQQQ